MVSYLSILLLLISQISCLEQSVIENMKEVQRQNQRENSKQREKEKGIFGGSSENVQTEEQDAGDAVVAYNSSVPIKKTLIDHKGDFDQDLFSELLTRKDLSHLLLSDIENMMDKMAKEFPEMIKITTIGQTWQGRDIRVLELDARKQLAEQGVQPQSLVQVPKPKKKSDDDEEDVLSPSNLNASPAENKTTEQKKEDVSKLSEQELLEKTEDLHREEQKKDKAKQDEFNSVSDDKKVEAMNDQLGINLMQTQSQIGTRVQSSIRKTKKPDHGLLQQKILLQLLKEEAEEAAEPADQSIADLTNLAKKEIKEQSKPEPSNENKQALVQQDVKNDQAPAESEQPKQEAAAPETTDLNKTLEANKTTTDENQVQTEESANKTTPNAEASIQELTQQVKQDNAEAAKQAQKGNKPEKPPAQISFYGDQAILITGATHARELLSMQVPLFMALKLMHQGLYQNKDRYQQMLLQTKYYILPVLNVDGAALVESNWLSKNKIINKRKNMNPNFAQCGEENSGVDLNRNFGIDWKAQNIKNKTELCGDFWPGNEAFSEPETRALRDFIGSKKNELKFVINCHTSGNEFIWPFNGREPNDIETRAPGYLAIFKEIADNAPFPDGVMKGNSYEVIGDPMGGDQDDYILSTFGIPSVTSEMGFFGQYIQDWRCQSKAVCFEILRENARWIEYIFGNLPSIAEKLTIK